MKNAVILVVEDNQDDVFFLERALGKTQLPVSIFIATDGQQAVDYLSGTGPYSNRAEFPLPFMILLDLKLPYRGGFEVLAWLRTQPRFQGLPVAVLTSSGEARDRETAASFGVSTYLLKPATPQVLLETITPLCSRPQ